MGWEKAVLQQESRARPHFRVKKCIFKTISQLPTVQSSAVKSHTGYRGVIRHMCEFLRRSGELGLNMPSFGPLEIASQSEEHYN